MGARLAAARLPLAPMAALGLAWAFIVAFPPDNFGRSDVPVYLAFARMFDAGEIPYADFPLEYPPLAPLLLWLPTVISGTGDLDAYERAFATLMLPFAWVVQASAARLAPPRWGSAVAWALVAMPLLFGVLVRERFDLAPVACVLVALALLARARMGTGPFLAGAALGFGGALKLFPLLLVPVVAVWLLAQGRRRDAGLHVGAAAAVVLVCSLPFLIGAPGGFFDQFTFHVKRPVQIESTPASLLWVIGESRVTDNYRSNGLDGGPAGTVAAVFAVALAVELLAAVALTWRAARREAEPALLLGALATLLAFVALGKVLSPQYLLWLAPLLLVALARGYRAIAVLGLGAVLVTSAYFPRGYGDLLAGDDLLVAAVAARNLLLAGGDGGDAGHLGAARSTCTIEVARRGRSSVSMTTAMTHGSSSEVS